MTRILVSAALAAAATLPLALALRAQQTESPGARIEAEPAGHVYRLPPGEANGPIHAPAEGEYTVPAGAVVEIECTHPFAASPAQRDEAERIAIRTEGPGVVALPADGFRNLISLRIDDDGKSSPGSSVPGRAVARLQALKPGDAMVELYIGPDTFTYEFHIVAPQEQPARPVQPPLP